MAVYVERNNSIKRSLERQVVELQTELKYRLLQIEQTQYEILKLYGHEIDVIAKYLYMLSPKRQKRLLSEMNLHYSSAPGISTVKSPMLKPTLSEKDITLVQQHKCDCHRSSSRNTDATGVDKSEQHCEVCSFRHRTLAKGNIAKKHIQEELYPRSNSFKGDIKRGESFSDKYLHEKDRADRSGLVSKLQHNSTLTHDHDQYQHVEHDGAGTSFNLTAFAFSRHNQSHFGAPLHRRSFESPNNERIKRGIRTKVVQNYLLCDVFKRLSDRNNSLARMKVDGMHEEGSDGGQYTRDVVKNLQKCRYLRVPKSLEEQDDIMPKIDIN